MLINKDENGMKIDITKYRGIIGSLVYLMISRPNVMFSVCMCARCHASPRESHFKTVKRILRYPNGNFLRVACSTFSLVEFFIMILQGESRIGKH